MKLKKTCIMIIVLLVIVSLTALAAAQGRRRGIKKEIWIPAAAFTASSAVDTNGCSIPNFEAGYLTGDDINGCLAVAPVIFPKGAKKIMEVEFYARDENEGGSVRLDLRRLELGANIGTALGSAQSAGYSGLVEAYVISLNDDLDIIESGYVYYLTTDIDINTFLYGVKIIYK